MSSAEPSESSSDIKKRVIAAREFMKQRCKETDKEYNGSVISAHLYKNADMTSAQIRRYCKMTDEANALLAAAYEKLQLSGRGHDRILRVARTIADMSQSTIIGKEHIAEAIHLRTLDRPYW